VGSNLRKTVTVLFCDLTGSTVFGETLDPERLLALLARYFERMKALVERHGGSVAKFIGDAVMAMFGVPLLHEDNALRAVRSAVEMRDALPELGLRAGRCSSRSRRRSPCDGRLLRPACDRRSLRERRRLEDGAGDRGDSAAGWVEVTPESC
jgi:class 3 adenylate cyclase